MKVMRACRLLLRDGMVAGGCRAATNCAQVFDYAERSNECHEEWNINDLPFTCDHRQRQISRVIVVASRETAQ